MAAQAQSFDTPDVHFNPGGWGPTEDDLPKQFLDVPLRTPSGKATTCRAGGLHGLCLLSAETKVQIENGTPEIETATSRTRPSSSSTTRRKTRRSDWSIRPRNRPVAASTRASRSPGRCAGGAGGWRPRSGFWWRYVLQRQGPGPGQGQGQRYGHGREALGPRPGLGE